MAYTQTQLDALRAAYARGAKSVSIDGRRVDFESGEEMRQRIAEIERDLAAASGKKPAKSGRVLTSRGYR